MTDLAVGDLVEITECRPLSKNKHFKVTQVLKRVPRVSEMVEESGLASAMKSKNSKKSSESSDSSSK
jgi:hypothetical protein